MTQHFLNTFANQVLEHTALLLRACRMRCWKADFCMYTLPVICLELCVCVETSNFGLYTSRMEITREAQSVHR